jgi:hypothetical protein
MVTLGSSWKFFFVKVPREIRARSVDTQWILTIACQKSSSENLPISCNIFGQRSALPLHLLWGESYKKQD